MLQVTTKDIGPEIIDAFRGAITIEERSTMAYIRAVRLFNQSVAATPST